MDYKTSYRIKLISICVTIILLILFLITGAEVTWLAVTAVAIFICDIMQAAMFFKCPHCGTHWDFRGKIPKYCPECGKKPDE